MIRKATYEDIPTMVELGKKFFEETKMGEFTTYDPLSAATTFKAMIDGDGAVIFLLEVGGEIVGGISAVLSVHYFNFDSITGQELFWFVDKEYRGTREALKLFITLENWVKEKKICSFSMVALHNLKDNNFETLQKLYLKRGYTPLEGVFVKGGGE